MSVLVDRRRLEETLRGPPPTNCWPSVPLLVYTHDYLLFQRAIFFLYNYLHVQHILIVHRLHLSLDDILPYGRARWSDSLRPLINAVTACSHESIAHQAQSGIQGVLLTPFHTRKASIHSSMERTNFHKIIMISGMEESCTGEHGVVIILQAAAPIEIRPHTVPGVCVLLQPCHWSIP